MRHSATKGTPKSTAETCCGSKTTATREATQASSAIRGTQG